MKTSELLQLFYTSDDIKEILTQHTTYACILRTIIWELEDIEVKERMAPDNPLLIDLAVSRITVLKSRLICALDDATLTAELKAPYISLFGTYKVEATRQSPPTTTPPKNHISRFLDRDKNAKGLPVNRQENTGRRHPQSPLARSPDTKNNKPF